MANPLAPAWLHVPQDANTLSGSLWPDSVTRDASGSMAVGGVSVQALVETCGSPLYVIDVATLRTRARLVKSALTDAFAAHGATVSLYYATKALIASDVVALIADEGYGADVSTLGELEWALASGMPAEDIEFLGNNKSTVEIARALEIGVGLIVLDSIQEIHRVEAAAATLGHTQRVAIRVNTGVHASTHEYLATAREDQKFGIARDDVDSAADRISRSPHLRLVGLHSHIGSQIFAVEGFIEAASRLLEDYHRLSADYPLELVNLGGGFGIRYTDADPEVNLEGLAEELAAAVASRCDELGMPIPHIAFEPGRSIVGPAGVTLYTVGTTKQVVVPAADGTEAVRLYVSVDGGMSDNLRPALYQADYTAILANRTSSEPPALVRVVGKHCESGDIVVDAGYLPGDVVPGDILAVAATGAYCFSLASNYNQLGRPALVLVDGGDITVSVRAETLEDLRSRDLGLSLRSRKGART